MPLHVPTLGERTTAKDIWTYTTRVLTDPDSYKADISGLLTKTQFDTKLPDVRAARIDYLDMLISEAGMKPSEEDKGTLTADGTEQEIVSKTSTEAFMAQLILDVSNMAGADQILIEETIKVLSGGTLEKFTRTRITGAQEEPILIFAPKYAVREYKVTLQQLAGIYRTFDWSLIVEE